MTSQQKIFIVSLPRTATTSICAFLLGEGLRVTHTAFTKEAFYQADVIADTPVFCDYMELDELFPGSRFIYIDRNVDSWLASIKTLLSKMEDRMNSKSEGFNPILKRCYQSVFTWKDSRFDLSDASLNRCYMQHREAVFDYFSGDDNFFVFQLGEQRSFDALCSLLSIDTDDDFPKLNMNGRINAWQQIKGANKVDPNASGVDRRRFFEYK